MLSVIVIESEAQHLVVPKLDRKIKWNLKILAMPMKG